MGPRLVDVLAGNVPDPAEMLSLLDDAGTERARARPNVGQELGQDGQPFPGALVFAHSSMINPAVNTVEFR